MVWCVYCYSLMYDHVLILLFQIVIWMLFHVFISLLWFLCIHINFYKSCSVSILDMYVWQMHFEHSLWQQSFLCMMIFCKSLVEPSFIDTYKSGTLLLPLSRQWTFVLQTHCSSYIFFQPLDCNLLLLPHYI